MIIFKLEAQEADMLGRALNYAVAWCQEMAGDDDEEIPKIEQLRNRLAVAMFGPEEPPGVDDVVPLQLTGRELLIVRECVKLTCRTVGLDEIFEEEDFAATGGDEDLERPTDAVLGKLAVHHYPDEPDSVLPAIVAANVPKGA